MKKLHLLGFIIITILFASCGTEKKGATQEQQQQINNPQPLLLQSQPLPAPAPCEDYYYDDNEYIRVLGIGTHPHQTYAKSFATDNAKREMYERVFNIIQTISNCDLYDINFKDISQKLQQDGMITPEGNVICVMREMQPTGNYIYYVAMQFSKENTKLNIIGGLNKISKEQNLGIDFSEEKFVNYMNTIMDIE